MWNNNTSSCISCVSSESVHAAVPSAPNNIMSKYVDYFYRQPTCTYYTYYDYLVVIDFEATCDNTRNDNPRPIRHERPEIIQFPAILVNVRTMEVEGVFNNFVKPVEDPVLSDFCTCLTGITQSMVKKAPTFPAVLRRFEGWLKSYGIALNNQEYGHSFAIVTDGSYDMGHFLYKQCIISQIPYPTYATRWVNIRTIFTKVYRRRWGCLKAALEFLNLPFEGRAHNGLDDSQNICKVLMQFLRAGCLIYQTEKILLQLGEQERNEARILNDKSAGKYDLATVAPLSTKEYEHICVYSTDSWSTHRTVPPEAGYEYASETDSSTESLVMLNSPDYCNNPLQQDSASAGSCESIASGCSNKENSIPMYIPNSKAPTKGRSSKVGTDGSGGVSVVSASSKNNGTTNGSSGRHGRRKKRNLQLKDPGSANSTSGTNGNNDAGVGTELSVSADASLQSHHLQAKSLDSDGSSNAHLEPLVSDLRTEE